MNENKFIAIDFETANSKRSSPCSLGIAIVENFKIVETKSFLIRPEPLEFEPYNIKIHGITADDVKDAPTFVEVWTEIYPILNNNLIVAHNASFDISVLRRTLEMYNCCLPNIDILCSCTVSKLAFPNIASHRLNCICSILDINLDHHDSTSDAAGCAQIVCTLAMQNSISSLTDFFDFFEIDTGYLDESNDYQPCRASNSFQLCRDSVKGKRAKDFLNICSDYIDDDFKDKYFVFTGTLLSMTRARAFEIVAKGGGIPQDTVTKKTNYLVCGLNDYRTENNGGVSGKLKKAYELKNKGQSIQIISEDDFSRMIDDELYLKCDFSQSTVGERFPIDQILSILNKCGEDTKYCRQLDYKENMDNSISVFFHNLLIFKVYQLKKKYSFLIKFRVYAQNKQLELMGIETYEVKESSSCSYKYTFDIDYPLFVEFVGLILSESDQYIYSNYVPEQFGCCGRYVECSDAEMCIHPDSLYAKGCQYGKHLKSGRIFYGKNKNI